MKHKHAELIKAWADNTDIRFEAGASWRNCDIGFVVGSPDHDWQIVKEPVVEVRYYRYEIVMLSLAKGYVECGSNNWNMKITITDNDIENAKVELR